MKDEQYKVSLSQYVWATSAEEAVELFKQEVRSQRNEYLVQNVTRPESEWVES